MARKPIKDLESVARKTDWKNWSALVALIAAAGSAAVFLGRLWLSSEIDIAINKKSEKIRNAATEATQLAAEAHSIVESLRKIHQSGGVVIVTDYAPGSAYVAKLRAGILKENPNAAIWAVVTDIRAFDVVQADWVVSEVAPYCPPGTIFLVIVGPSGVDNPPILLVTKKGHVFFGYRNGSLDGVGDHDVSEAYVLRGEHSWRPGFDSGLDILAREVGKATRGTKFLDQIAKDVTPYVRYRQPPQHEIKDGVIHAAIMYVDPFGNAVTNVTPDDLKQLGAIIAEKLEVRILPSNTTTVFTYQVYYHNVERLQPVAVFKDESLQLAIREGHFVVDRNSIPGGTEVELRRRHSP